MCDKTNKFVYEDNCDWDNNEFEQKRAIESGGRDAVLCSNCEGVGHYDFECTSPKRMIYQKRFNVCAMNGNNLSKKNNDWFLDSGSTGHLCNDRNMFISMNEYKCDIQIADGNNVTSEGKGDIKLKCGSSESLTIKNVLFVPKLAMNLLSISQIVSRGNSVIFDKNGCKILDSNGEIMETASLESGMYKLDNVENIERCNSAVQSGKAEVWHRRLGHLNLQSLIDLKNGMVHGISFDRNFIGDCEECVKGKAHRKSFPHSKNVSTSLLELIHTDLCGPMEVQSIGGKRYVLTFIDDKSKKCFTYFLRQKSEVSRYFLDFKKMSETQTGEKIKIVRSDGGGEFMNNAMDKICKDNGIIHQSSLPYTPEQNGTAERFNRSLVERARCMLINSRLPKSYWAEAINTSAYLLNRSPHKGLDQCPEEIWSGKKPTVSHLRVFGCTAFFHIPKQRRKKLDSKAEKAILVGYSETSKAYRLMNKNHELVLSRDVTFFENRFEGFNSKDERDLVTFENVNFMVELSRQQVQNALNPIIEDNQDISLPFISMDNSLADCEVNSISDTEVGEVHSVSNTEVGEVNSDVDTEVGEVDLGNISIQDNDGSGNQQPAENSVRRSERIAKLPPKHYTCASANITDSEEPLSVHEALNSDQKHEWQEAMQSEIDSLIENKTWTSVKLPVGKNAIKTKWVFKIKKESGGNLRYKARLVCKGFTQKKGIDFEETYSPVVRYTSIRYLMAMACRYNLEIFQMDAVTAFLQGELHEEIYISTPEGIQNVDGNVFKLQKALYGLKQASLTWNKKLDSVLLKNGLKRSKVDPCIYFKRENGNIIFVAIYVDDILLFSNNYS